MSVRFGFIVGVLGTFALTAAVGLGCDKTPPPNEGPAASASTTAVMPPTPEGPIRVSGSSALQPLVNAAKEKFEAQNKGASIEVSAGGSKKGLVDVASGAVHVGDSDIFAAADQKDLVDHKVAVVGFAAMANKGPYDAKIAALGMDQLAKVFSGEIKSWKELGGEAQPIVVINRAPASGTRTVFGNVVLGGDKFVESQTEDNSGALVAKLKQTKGSISYLALSFKDDELLTLSLKIGAQVIDPTPDNIAQGRYPIWSYEHMYTKGPSTGAAKQFIDFILSSDFQTGVLPNVKGFIPITLMKAQRDKD
jgi:phosphate transport system substrate-binding protein